MERRAGDPAARPEHDQGAGRFIAGDPLRGLEQFGEVSAWLAPFLRRKDAPAERPVAAPAMRAAEQFAP